MAKEADDRAVGVVEARALLRRAVLQTELRPGGMYSQDEVRKMLDVGRTPFREALRMVQVEHLIDILPNGRLQVPALSMEDFTRVQVARIALESAAARLSVPKLTTIDLAHLEGYMAQMSHYLSSDDFDQVETPHLEFHDLLLSGAGPLIAAKVGELSDRVRPYRWAHSVELQAGWPERTDEHRAVLDSAIAGDVEGVVVSLVLHYLNAGLRLADRMEQSEGFDSHEHFERDVLTSLAPSVREAVLLKRR